MIEFGDPGEMRAWARARRAEGRRIGLVPTMGALHAGHLALVERARELSDTVVASVFVNPLQFGPSEDLEHYPRTLTRDREVLARHDVACLFAPDAEAMYPTEPVIRVDPGTMADHLCGPYRPGHFGGVLTVVAKLFHIVEPDVAIFGRKDAQQAAIVRRLVHDLSFMVAVDVVPTVREADGLALSSRNAYLTPPQREAATVLARALDGAHDAFAAGETDAGALCARVRDVVAGEPAVALQYVEVVDPLTMQPVGRAVADSLVALAARLGDTRLIDNVVLGRGTAGDQYLRRESSR